MKMESISEKTRRIVRADRLEAMRAHADELNSFCFFVSMYEAAFHIHEHDMPPRPLEAHREWIHMDDGKTKGSVATSRILDVLLRISSKLELQVDTIYAAPKFAKHIRGEIVVPQRGANQGENHSGKKPYRSHAETQTSSLRTTQRIQDLYENDWETAAIITFSKSTNGVVSNSRESMRITEYIGELTIPHPFILLLLKKE